MYLKTNQRMKWHCVAQIVKSPVLITSRAQLIDLVPLPVNIFSNKVGPNVVNNILRNTLFCCFTSFSIVLLVSLNQSQVLLELLELYLFHDIFNFFISDYQCYGISLRIPASTADATPVNGNSIKVLLANDISTFFINGKPTLINGPVKTFMEFRNLSIN